MKVTRTNFENLLVIEPAVYFDDRGHFFESYNHRNFQQAGIDFNFVQDNQSFSKKNVVRGLHFQKPPFEQTKLVRVLDGAILDVAVDLRRESATYRQSFTMEISSENGIQLLIPKGFAHGFLVKSDAAVVLYKCDEYYKPGAEGGIRFDDPSLAVDWGDVQSPILSGKDLALPYFSSVEKYF